MPHFKDGSEAHVGDVAKKTEGLVTTIGVIAVITPGSTTCNAQLGLLTKCYASDDLKSRVAMQVPGIEYATLGQCEKIA